MSQSFPSDKDTFVPLGHPTMEGLQRTMRRRVRNQEWKVLISPAAALLADSALVDE